MNNVLGSQNSKFSTAQLPGRQMAASPSTGVANTVKTYIPTVPRGMVAIIDKVYLQYALVSGAGTATLTINLNGGALKFNARADAATSTNGEYVLDTKGSLVVVEGSALTMQASAVNQWFVEVNYRLMNHHDAVVGGYLPGVPFVGNVTATGDIITSATVTKQRGLDVRGICITGYQSSAAAGGNTREVMVGFWDGTTERKIVKNCYGTTNSLHVKPLIIANGRFRGPRSTAPFTANSHGIRATMTDATAAVAVWGFYYTDKQKTFPGTGVPPASATGAFDAGEYFWHFSEAVITSATALTPATTVGQLTNGMVIDGYAISMAGDVGDAAVCSLTFTDVVGSTVSGPVALNCIGAGNAGSTTVVREGVALPMSINRNAAIGIVTLATDADKIGFTVWGRFGGTGIGLQSDTYHQGA